MAPLASDKKLTIGMATYDEYDGVYFTVQALRLHHPEVADEIDFLVVDNHPGGPCADALRQLGERVPYRYLATEEIRGTAVRDLIFREARTPYVLCVDCHVLIAPGAVRRLIEFLDERPDCRDLLQGPLVDDSLQRVATHFAPTWNDGMYGVWATDEQGSDPEGEPFEIPMQGLGVFACRTDAWPGFNPRFTGFGGEEGYIHEKFRQAGGRTLCLPFLRWLHRFQRPVGVHYPNTWRDRFRNYLIGIDELDLDPDPFVAHFREHLDAETTEKYLGEVRRELSNPLFFFDAVYCVNAEAAAGRREAMQRRFEALGVAHRVRWFAAAGTSESRHVGCARRHRAIVERARRQGLESVLVIEDDAIFLEDALAHLERSLAELRSREWNLFYLGGFPTRDEVCSDIPGCAYLRSPGPDLSCSGAIAYNRPVFQKILDEVSPEVAGVREQPGTERAIDETLRRVDKRFVARPSVASQPSILDREGDEVRDRFTLGGDPPNEPEAAPAAEGVFCLSAGYDVITLDDRVVLYRLERTHTLALSATAGIVLELMDGRRTVAQIRQLLQEAYPESAVDVGLDVDRTIRELLAGGALERPDHDVTPEANGVAEAG